MMLGRSGKATGSVSGWWHIMLRGHLLQPSSGCYVYFTRKNKDNRTQRGVIENVLIID